MNILNTEQVNGLRFDLQAFGDESPATAAGTPPTATTSTAQTTSSPVLSPTPAPNQAPTTPSGPSLEEQYQNALRGMNAAQQEAAPWKKFSEETGMTHEQAWEMVQYFQAIKQNPQLAIAELAKQNPQMALQAISGLMGQQQNDPYAPLAEASSDPVAYGKSLTEVVKQQLMAEFEQKFTGQLNPLQQKFQQREQQEVFSKIDAQVNAFAGKYGDAGATPQTIWDYIKTNYKPDQSGAVLANFQSVAINAMGGMEKFETALRDKYIKEYQEQVQSNATQTATLTSSSGIPAAPTRESSVNSKERRERLRDSIIALSAAQK